MNWHVQSELLERYARGDIDEVQAFSVEAHLPSCAQCRAEIAELVDGARLARVWEGVEERLDAPRRGPIEAGLMRVGVPEHVARLLGATPALRLSWLLACALVLAFAVWAASLRAEGVYWFLVLAPLLPLAGVAAAYGPDVDPTYEIGLAAPMRSFKLLLVRALAVLVTTSAMVTIAALALPGLHSSAAAWLAPSLGLTLASLALAARISPLTACGTLAVLWMLTAWAGWRLAQEPLDLFGPAAQLTCALLAAVAALVLARNADSFERRGDMA
jgi:anti-sigma factor RsiW